MIPGELQRTSFKERLFMGSTLQTVHVLNAGMHRAEFSSDAGWERLYTVQRQRQHERVMGTLSPFGGLSRTSLTSVVLCSMP